MTTSVGQIGLDLVINSNGFKKQMSGITGLAKKAALALAAAFSVKKLVDFGKSCLELGSDLAEVQNVVDVTFPNMTAQVDEFARSAITSAGLSETMAKQFTGMFGAMAKAFGFSEQQAYDMSTSLTQLAGDVASFYNLSQEEAYTKLKSVFTGETESLKDLGVVMTQTALDSYAMANGFEKTTQAMSEAEKVALRYQFVQEQLSAASGDFARTSDSWANQVRILKLQVDSLKATIGQGLINLFTPIIKTVNTLIGKLGTLANAFKAFTELITGNKSSGSSGIADMGAAATEAGSGLENASGAADNVASSAKRAGNAAKKAAKEIRALMGFDQINKLPEQADSSGDADTGNSGSISGGIGSAVDFGSLARGETVLAKTDKQIAALMKRCKELAVIFRKGFKIGFGDSEKKIKSITKSLQNIGKAAKKIFTDTAVVSAANRWVNSLVLAFGTMTGFMARMGLTIADNLIGGFDRYIAKSKDFIKQRLISVFNVSADIATLTSDLCTAFAVIFDVFSNNDAKGITSDIIGIFSDGFLGAIDLGMKFVNDVFRTIVQPVTDNVEKIKIAFENTLQPIRIVLDTLYAATQQTFQKIFEVYDAHIKPLFESLAEGLTNIVGAALDAYNNYIAPVLQELAEKLDSVWNEHIQPVIDKAIELIGKIADLIKTIWENILVPMIEWLINNIVPVIGPIIETVGGAVLELVEIIGDVAGDIIEILSGIIDFLTGVFSGDWSKAFSGLEEIGNGFYNAMKHIFEFLNGTILAPFIKWINDVLVYDWSKDFGVIGDVLNTFFETARDICEDVQRIFGGIIDFVAGTFTGDWERAWQGVQNIFGGIFEGLVTLVKAPFNAIIDLMNGLIGKVNSFLDLVSSALTFDVGFENPFTGKRVGFSHTTRLGHIGQIPHLAQGGFVEKNTPQLAMIGDNRHQGEVVAPEDKLKQMAMEAARAAAGSGGITKEELERIINNAVLRIVAALGSLAFFVDSEELAKAVMAGMESIDGRYNPVKFV